MTQDEIIRMAREAGFTGCLTPEEADDLIGGVFIADENWVKPLERFTALVAAHEREKFYGKDKPAECINGCSKNQVCDYCQIVEPVLSAVLAEREACAKVCDTMAKPETSRDAQHDFHWAAGCCAASIRARGEA